VQKTTTINGLQERSSSIWRSALNVVLRLELPLFALWLALGTALAAVTGRVVDWFVMTDELLYERLGISVAQLESPLPHVRGGLIPNVSQLYPLLLATVFRHGLVPSSLHDAHVLNAYLMTSAAIPAFLLARSVTGRRLPAYLAAVLSVCVPWIVLSSFLLTEVVAYPASLWCLLALHQATAHPRLRNDVLAVLALALATLARTQLLVLAAVLPVAILLHEMAFPEDEDAETRGRRFLAACRRTLARHRVLGAVYGLLILAVVVLVAAGRFSSSLGTYSDAAEGDVIPPHFVSSLGAHLATIALGLGILPFVIGAAWLGAGVFRPRSRQAHAFAAVGGLALVVLTLEVTSFDLRFGGGVVRDRYLFYVVPIVLIAFLAALFEQGRWPRWSLLPPVLVLLYGFHHIVFTPYAACKCEKLNVDTPVSVLDDGLRNISNSHSFHAAHLLLIGVLLLSTAVFLEATVVLRRSWVAGALVVLLLVGLPAETSYAFQRLFRVNGTAGRPLTLDQGVVFDWVDRIVGPNADVTMVPYPVVPGDYYSGVGFWWDLEFWNKSVVRAAYLPHEFQWTPSTFPETVLHFNPTTGLANVSPTTYVAESFQESRFHISGTPVPSDADTRGTSLIQADQPWRTDWLTFGLSDDGWTSPGRTGRVRVFATPGQKRSEIRTIGVGVIAPNDVASRPFTLTSNQGTIQGTANAVDRVVEEVPVCVPAHGYSDVTLSTPDSSPTYNDPNSYTTFAAPTRRVVGVQVTQVALADEIGGRC
jgi:hypothetical protein